MSGEGPGHDGALVDALSELASGETLKSGVGSFLILGAAPLQQCHGTRYELCNIGESISQLLMCS